MFNWRSYWLSDRLRSASEILKFIQEPIEVVVVIVIICDSGRRDLLRWWWSTYDRLRRVLKFLKESG
jgi:hypothetical protein